MFFEKSLDFFKFAVAFFHGKEGVKKDRGSIAASSVRGVFSL
jgi:hypothetical protein